jgi:hypothetical protein
MDGTFTSTPEIFVQLYTLHIKVDDEFIPQLWCWLPDKQAATYTRLFQLMAQKATAAHLQLHPTVIHIDFEMAVVQAVRAVFGIEPSGCLFHFGQSILRHVQQCGLQTSYNDSNPPAVREWIRRLIALPLVAPLKLDQAFQAIVAAAPNVPGANQMNDYVNDTYLNPNTAMFPRAVWNCFGQKDRTTNVCEGYHSVLNSHFRQRHPSPFAFIDFLKQQEGETERRVAQLQHGAPPRKRKAKYVLVDEALDRLRNTYFGNGVPGVNRLLQYLDAVAHQLNDVKH